jgi:hypothetical protein
MSTKRRSGEVSTMVEVGSDAGAGSQRMCRLREMSPILKFGDTRSRVDWWGVALKSLVEVPVSEKRG